MALDGKVVFITGAARGIGAEVARQAAARGARIALAGLEPDELAARASELGSEHAHFECDVTDQESIEAAVTAAAEQLGGIDIVLANAGIATYGTVEKGDPAAWIKTVEINLIGAYRTVQATLPHVLERRGYIGIVASVASFAPTAGMSSYNASKAGVEAFGRALRQEVGFRGVDVGTIHPSWIDTDMVRESEQDMPSFRDMRAKLPWPVKSTTSVEECARAIVDGFENRSSRVFVPRAVALLYWLRSLITSGPGERVATREAATLIPRMEREIDALGRSSSSRTGSLNRLNGRARESATKAPDQG
jgi:NAD(P)-dependent dehydrogenase (short-subunit alcohol dehydrogenase family)